MKPTVDTPDGLVVVLGATEVAAGARVSSGKAVRHRPVLVDGVPGHTSWRPDGTPLSVIAFTVTEDRISGIPIVVGPAKLTALHLPAPA